MSVIQRIFHYKWLWSIFVFFLVLDQFTKFWVKTHIPAGTYFFPGPIAVIPDFLYWVHIYNTGAAWGMFSGMSIPFAVLAIAVIILIFLFRDKLELKTPIMQVIGGLLISGTIGNLIDRLVYGHVLDFIDVHLPFYRWPAFNVADSAICVAVFMYIFYSFCQKK